MSTRSSEITCFSLCTDPAIETRPRDRELAARKHLDIDLTYEIDGNSVYDGAGLSPFCVQGDPLRIRLAQNGGKPDELPMEAPGAQMRSSAQTKDWLHEYQLELLRSTAVPRAETIG